MRKKISICVCTRRRPQGILTLLQSVDELHIPEDVEVSVVVVENDSQPFTKDAIEAFSKNSRTPIKYFLEQEPGISYARNRTVKESVGAGFCCFVDDDQKVDPDWLLELARCQKEFDCEGVWGPNPPIFKENVPVYVHQFHLPELYSYGESVAQAYTNCLLVKKSALDAIEGPFDLRLNFTGGEDCLMTKKVIANGGVIKFTPFAKAFEIVPEDRTTLRYMMKRTSRTINTKYILKTITEADFSKYSILPRLFLRLVNGLLQSLPFYLMNNANKYKGLLKVSDAAGGLMFVFGRKNKFYK